VFTIWLGKGIEVRRDKTKDLLSIIATFVSIVLILIYWLAPAGENSHRLYKLFIDCIPDSGEYCRARHKLNAQVLRQLVREITEQISLSVPVHWLWLGKNVKLVDGFTFTMPDTLENQKEFPQSKTQKPDVGFPIARTCAVISLADACIYNVAIGPYAGKETGETALLRKILDSFKPADVMLADRYFCSFFV